MKIPLILKILHTLFVCILIPIYWRHYGPANFLWFSDIALFLTVIALWLESPFLASMQAVSIILLELLWIIDFLTRLTTGVRLVGLADYMFKPENPLFIRGLSLFHLWLPFLLLWMVYRLGYDGRAWIAQSLFAWIILLFCYFLTDPAENINWAFGPKESPQTSIPSWLYLILIMIFFPVCIYFPTHLALRTAISARMPH
jgi:hypothetical protein